MQEGGGWVSREDGVRRQRIGCQTSTDSADPKGHREGLSEVGGCGRVSPNRRNKGPKIKNQSTRPRPKRQKNVLAEEWMQDEETSGRRSAKEWMGGQRRRAGNWAFGRNLLSRPAAARESS